jgi:hypothetical protein
MQGRAIAVRPCCFCSSHRSRKDPVMINLFKRILESYFASAARFPYPVAWMV